MPHKGKKSILAKPNNKNKLPKPKSGLRILSSDTITSRPKVPKRPYPKFRFELKKEIKRPKPNIAVSDTTDTKKK